MDLHEAVRALSVDGKFFEDICERCKRPDSSFSFAWVRNHVPHFRIPITDIFLAKRRKKRDSSKTFDNTVYEYGDEFNFYTGEVQRDYADYAPGVSGQDLGKKHTNIQTYRDKH